MASLDELLTTPGGEAASSSSHKYLDELFVYQGKNAKIALCHPDLFGFQRAANLNGEHFAEALNVAV